MHKLPRRVLHLFIFSVAHGPFVFSLRVNRSRLVTEILGSTYWRHIVVELFHFLAGTVPVNGMHLLSSQLANKNDVYTHIRITNAHLVASEKKCMAMVIFCHYIIGKLT